MGLVYQGASTPALEWVSGHQIHIFLQCDPGSVSEGY